MTRNVTYNRGLVIVGVAVAKSCDEDVIIAAVLVMTSDRAVRFPKTLCQIIVNSVVSWGLVVGLGGRKAPMKVDRSGHV